MMVLQIPMQATMQMCIPLLIQMLNMKLVTWAVSNIVELSNLLFKKETQIEDLVLLSLNSRIHIYMYVF